MAWMPFVCLGVGFSIGMQNLPVLFFRGTDLVITLTLIALMLTIGANIGVNDTIMPSLASIGLNCLFITAMAIGCSIILTVAAEKTFIPLEKIRQALRHDHINLGDEISLDNATEERPASALIYIIPLSVVAGVLAGYFIIPKNYVFILSYSLILSLIVLYTGVGISMGANRKVFRYVRILGWRIVALSVLIALGSILGGFLAGLILQLPVATSVLAATGMSYYSLTGAYMTQIYGIETGTYGFIVNIMREFLTVLLLPLLIRISKGSPMASGAAGNMDTVLVPITKFVGPELGLVTLIIGTILTFAVPLLLPLINGIVS